jgi:hypothetical protein
MCGPRTLIAISWIWVVTALTAKALTWEKAALDLSVEAGSGDLVAEFPFKNEGSAPVTIRELAASCGCTTPTVETKLVPVGGKGVIKLNYVVGDRVGPQSVHVTVTTDEAGATPSTLNLRVNIQPAVSLTPRLVHWTKADGPMARTIEIKRLSKAAVQVSGGKPANDMVLVELKPGTEPDTWLLKLTPKSVEAPFTTKVEIPITVGERKMTYSVFAVVR